MKPEKSNTAETNTVETNAVEQFILTPENVGNITFGEYKLIVNKYIGNKFESEYIDSMLPQSDKWIEDTKKEYRELYTAKLTFDFAGCSLSDMILQMASTTTVSKMYYNNLLQKLDKEQALEFCKEAKTVLVKNDIWDVRSKVSVSDEVKVQRNIKKAIDSGKLTKEQLIELINNM